VISTNESSLRKSGCGVNPV